MFVPVIDIQDATKTYHLGTVNVHALRGIDLRVYQGEMVAIMGPSGSGKSTLMNIVGCLDVPSSGIYLLDGTDVSSMTDDELAVLRNKKIGFCFQSFNLLARTTALSNVELPLVYAGVKDRRRKAEEALARVGLADRMDHKPNELSGGQQQRVAIARAIVNSPSLILADEPTGALDSHTSEEIMALFQSLNRDDGITVVFVTHERDVALHTPRIVHIRDGIVHEEEHVPDPIDAKAGLERLRLAETEELIPS